MATTASVFLARELDNLPQNKVLLQLNVGMYLHSCFLLLNNSLYTCHKAEQLSLTLQTRNNNRISPPKSFKPLAMLQLWSLSPCKKPGPFLTLKIVEVTILQLLFLCQSSAY